jgi:hypothetical protein
MNTHSVRVVLFGFLATIILVASQGCVSSPRRGPDGRPHKVRPHHHRDGLAIPVTTPVIVQKRATPPEERRRKALRKGMQLGTQTVDFETAWPTGLTGTATLDVRCYPAYLDEVSGVFYVANDTTTLAVFGGTTAATVSFSNSNPPTSLRASVDVNIDNESGNFFYLGVGKSIPSGGNTYTFSGGMILTKP